MKKKIFILLALILLTGCKAKYNLQINFGGNVIETSNVYLNNSLVGRNGYSSNKDEFLDEIAEKYNFNMMPKKMKFKEGNYLGYKTYRRYNNISIFSRTSPAIAILYDSLSVTEENNRVIIKTIGDSKIPEYHNPSSDNFTAVEAIEINITLPYKVTKVNTARIDTETNTFTWVFNGNSREGINLEYRTDEWYTTNPLYLMKFVSIYVYISIFLILTLIIIILVVQSKFRSVNKI